MTVCKNGQGEYSIRALIPIHWKKKTQKENTNTLRKRRQPSKAGRMSGPAFRDILSSNQSLLRAVYVADAEADVMKDSKSK